ncbi:DNA-directed RNA polymerase subunit RPC12/RpoP [Chryseobacterium sp. H1D6B]|uniref:hypothetical protein n=1 Tax=Chryseobacterium sp. H1D6B TaxID=2940588 RepID=UPI0015C7D693|nr:hypothetical protein [Chryseobacterium sp. H1D6B]MDH6252453.1 DNA-directed RNA polymerase subunit RPC12/RpoP [Chryseobacterium sp. H1D6B]
METPHITEEYFCVNCDKFLHREDVYKTWDCPVCNHIVHIRIITDEKDNACFRVLPQNLIVGDIVFTHRESDYHAILRVIDHGNMIQLNLKNYGSLKVEKNRYVLKIDGGWYH